MAFKLIRVEQFSPERCFSIRPFSFQGKMLAETPPCHMEELLYIHS